MLAKVIMVSGANRGIGRSLVDMLAAEGYRLSLGVREPTSCQVDFGVALNMAK